jgi:hypothetical protein
MSKSTDTKLRNLQTSKPRQQRSDKKTRVSPYFDDDTHIKLQLLASATGHSKGSLAEFIVRTVLNDVTSVENLQKEFAGRAPKEYAIRALPIGDKIVYRIAGEDYEAF